MILARSMCTYTHVYVYICIYIYICIHIACVCLKARFIYNKKGKIYYTNWYKSIVANAGNHKWQRKLFHSWFRMRHIIIFGRAQSRDILRDTEIRELSWCKFCRLKWCQRRQHWRHDNSRISMDGKRRTMVSESIGLSHWSNYLNQWWPIVNCTLGN